LEGIKVKGQVKILLPKINQTHVLKVFDCVAFEGDIFSNTISGFYEESEQLQVQL